MCVCFSFPPLTLFCSHAHATHYRFGNRLRAPNRPPPSPDTRPSRALPVHPHLPRGDGDGETGGGAKSSEAPFPHSSFTQNKTLMKEAAVCSGCTRQIWLFDGVGRNPSPNWGLMFLGDANLYFRATKGLFAFYFAAANKNKHFHSVGTHRLWSLSWWRKPQLAL